MSQQYRQGDVLLCAIDRIPSRAVRVPREENRVVVARGELSGHAHAFVKRARLLREKHGRRAFLVIGAGGAELMHEEHDPILVPAGHYELLRQREYDPLVPRYVRD